MITRFAPSPTGLLHLGHAFAARVAHDRARDEGGAFLLRYEDIDHTRTRPEFYAAVEEDLKWLGLSWDGEPIRQMDRLAEYQKALEELKEQGMVYPCFCTRREIEAETARILNAPHGPEGPLYPGTCRRLDQETRHRLLGSTIPAWRLDSQKAAQATGVMNFRDKHHGMISVDPLLLGDVILARKDIGTSYHLAVVCDDAAQGVTLVTRGEDLLSSTHVHVLLQALLGLPLPEYYHHPLILDRSGARLAKRSKAYSLRAMRENGLTPEEVFSKMPLAP